MSDDVRLSRSALLRAVSWAPVLVLVVVGLVVALMDAVALGSRRYDEIATWSAGVAVILSPLSVAVSTAVAVAASQVSRRQGPHAARALWAAPVAAVIVWTAQCGMAGLYTLLHISQMNFALA